MSIVVWSEMIILLLHINHLNYLFFSLFLTFSLTYITHTQTHTRAHTRTKTGTILWFRWKELQIHVDSRPIAQNEVGQVTVKQIVTWTIQWKDPLTFLSQTWNISWLSLLTIDQNKHLQTFNFTAHSNADLVVPMRYNIMTIAVLFPWQVAYITSAVSQIQGRGNKLGLIPSLSSSAQQS